MEIRLEDLSRVVSHALRHAPSEYNLILDKEGWVSVEKLIFALQAKDNRWENLSEANLIKMIDCSSKKRHEIKLGKIRALYGHSVGDKIEKIPMQPPVILYHGTSPETVEIIKKEGLKSMKRHYVHLSKDIETARQVGFRKSHHPTILIIRAEEASRNGIDFYHGNENIWLADPIPAEYVDLFLDIG